MVKMAIPLIIPQENMYTSFLKTTCVHMCLIYKFLFVRNESSTIQSENNRMGKTGDVFRKIGDMKGTLYRGWAQ